MIKIPRKAPEIIERFLASGETDQELDWASCNRDKESVYISVLKYAKKYPELDVTVRRIKGQIWLIRTSAMD